MVLIIPFSLFSMDISEVIGDTTLFIYAFETNLHHLRITLDVLSKTEEVKSGDWKRMRGLMEEVQKQDESTLYWFSNPDGSYYTVEKGLTDYNLQERKYFEQLQKEESVYGAVITGYTSLKKSVVVARPVYKGETLVGYLGGSKYTDSLVEYLDMMAQDGVLRSFYVITAEGEDIIQYNINEEVAQVLNALMLETGFGLYPMSENSPLEYQYVFGPSPETGWLYAVGKKK
jgi:hypothetical protein